MEYQFVRKAGALQEIVKPPKKLELNVAEAVEAYHDLKDYNNRHGLDKSAKEEHPARKLEEKIKRFLNEHGFEIK